MGPYFIMRVDDVCPAMNWPVFTSLIEFLNYHSLNALIGVVPDNRDSTLEIDHPRNDFWDVVSELNHRGWTIAQHGYQHIYQTNNPGLLRINKRSEFAGLPYDKQYSMINAGKNILECRKLFSDVFMAPGHSFDEITLQVLKDTGFRYITDGYGIYPYQKNDIVFIPQLFSSFLHFGFGIYTICIHVNHLSKIQVESLFSAIEKNKRHILGFYEAVRCKGFRGYDLIPRCIIEYGVRSARYIRGRHSV
jgi:predicted deacetylase